MPGKTDPLTVEEMTDAAKHFANLFAVISEHFPKAPVEDQLKIMESVAKYAHSQRTKKRMEEAELKFGFNKDTNPEESTFEC